MLPAVGDVHDPILVCRYGIAQAQLSAQVLHQLLVLHDLLPDRQTHAHWDRDTMTYYRTWNMRGRGLGARSLQFVVVFWFLRKTTRLYLLNILKIKLKTLLSIMYSQFTVSWAFIPLKNNIQTVVRDLTNNLYWSFFSMNPSFGILKHFAPTT